MSTDPSLRPWLIIVHRDDDRLYRRLRAAFESDSRVSVIKDRRRATRRQQALPVQADRRKTDRRAPPPVQDERMWQSLRFRLIHRDAEIEVYEAPDQALPTPRRASRRPAGKRRASNSARPRRRR